MYPEKLLLVSISNRHSPVYPNQLIPVWHRTYPPFEYRIREAAHRICPRDGHRPGAAARITGERPMGGADLGAGYRVRAAVRAAVRREYLPAGRVPGAFSRSLMHGEVFSGFAKNAAGLSGASETARAARFEVVTQTFTKFVLTL